jgi:hypothetical protein
MKKVDLENHQYSSDSEDPDQNYYSAAQSKRNRSIVSPDRFDRVVDTAKRDLKEGRIIEGLQRYRSGE